jgi:hypothetical protein
MSPCIFCHFLSLRWVFHWRIFHLLGHESFHLVPFSLLLLGALFYWRLVSFHRSKSKLKFLKKTFQWRIIQFERCTVTHYRWQSTSLFFSYDFQYFIIIYFNVKINIHFMGNLDKLPAGSSALSLQVHKTWSNSLSFAAICNIVQPTWEVLDM